MSDAADHVETATREILANARRGIAKYHLDGYYTMDVDSIMSNSMAGARSWIASRIRCCAGAARRWLEIGRTGGTWRSVVIRRA